MIYFILPVFLLFYFELLGLIISNKYNIRKFRFNAVLGFSIILFVCYVFIFLVVYFNLSFIWLLLMIVSIITIISVYIFLNRSYLIFELNIKIICVLVLLVFIQFFFVLKNNIGGLFQYDTINYTNLVTSNIYLDGLNTFDMNNGYPIVLNQYSYQSYYSLASVLYYLMNGICNKLGIQFFYFTQHTWMYSTILYVLFGEMIINFIYEFKINKKINHLFIFLFIFLFMSNFYWNSEQAYLGNSYRMLLLSYTLLYTNEYIKDNRYENLILTMIFLVADCACASSNITTLIIYVFGMWLVLKDQKNELRTIILFSVVPLINILFVLYLNHYILPMIIVLGFVFIFEKQFNYIVTKFKLRIILPIIIGLFLIVTSYLISGNLFDFNAFTNNLSGWSDMTWDYTDSSTLWRLFANVIYFVLMIVCCVKNRTNKIIKMICIIALVFFNPFGATVQNKYMITFYRNYDICINYLTLFMGVKVLDEMIINKKLSFIVSSILCGLSLYVAINQIEYHPNDEWNKTEDYNDLLRMTNDETDVITVVKDWYIRNNKYDVKGISSVLPLRTEIPRIRTLYGRSKRFNGIWDEYELYKVFYPYDYYGDEFGPKDAKFDEMCSLLEDAKYELIVQDKRIDVYDEEQDSYYSIKYLIARCDYEWLYENDTYVVFVHSYE